MTSSSARGGHVTHYYVAVVPANLRVSSNDVRLDEVGTVTSLRLDRVAFPIRRVARRHYVPYINLFTYLMY